MKIHEYQGKELFRKAGVPVLAGQVARTPEEAAAAYTKLGGKIAVVKAQIHAGGRGKGTIVEVPTQRGVQLVKSAEEAATVAKNLLGNSVGMLAEIRQANDHNSARFRHVKETQVGFLDQ